MGKRNQRKPSGSPWSQNEKAAPIFGWDYPLPKTFNCVSPHLIFGNCLILSFIYGFDGPSARFTMPRPKGMSKGFPFYDDVLLSSAL